MNPISWVIEKVKTKPKPVVPEGMVIGVPGQWYTYGY
jgi:hypothetical protein